MPGRERQLQRTRDRLDDPAPDRQDAQAQEEHVGDAHGPERHLPREAAARAVGEEGVEPIPGAKPRRAKPAHTYV